MSKTEYCFGVSDKTSENLKTACHNSLPSIGNLMNYSSETFYEIETPMLLKLYKPKASIPFRIENWSGFQPTLLVNEKRTIKLENVKGFQPTLLINEKRTIKELPKRIEIKFTTTIPYKIPKTDKNNSKKEIKFVVTKISDSKLKEVPNDSNSKNSESIMYVKVICFFSSNLIRQLLFFQLIFHV